MAKKGAGRPKGSLNKRTIALSEQLHKLDLDPVLELKECYEELQGIVCYEPGDRIENVNAKVRILGELMSYLYPKRKAIDITHDINEQAHIVWDFRYGNDSPDTDSSPKTHDITAETNSTSGTPISIPEKI